MRKGVFFVLVQFGCIFYLLFTGNVFAKHTFLLLLECLGIFVGVWAILIMVKTSQISITPEVKPAAKLVIKGPYQWIRHPMYTAILVTFLPLIIENYSIDRIITYLLLTVDLLLKLHYEENLLTEKFGDSYISYQSQSKRLLPFIY